MRYSRPVRDIMRERFSCRTYSGAPLPEEARERLAQAAEALQSGPLGASLRFRLAAAAPGDTDALKGLGTYGTIRGATAFLLGAAVAKEKYLEDFGFAFEQLILLATDMGLGSCWLGGFFSRGAFSRRMQLARSERIPSVASIGVIPEDQEGARQGMLRTAVGGSRRRPWEELFFDGGGSAALTQEAAGAYAGPLEMVRLAPSASNKQPWRVLREGRSWHFFLQRTPGYPGRLGTGLLGIEDIQRVDIGIAMCHFELTAREQGLDGAWRVMSPAPVVQGKPLEYVVSWEG